MTGGAARLPLDETHDVSLRSWVAGAQAPGTDFPVQNLPFGIVRRGAAERPRVGIAIGDEVLDCLAAERAGCFDELPPAVREALRSTTLNAMMSLGRSGASAVRRAASRLLRTDTAQGVQARSQRDTILVGMNQVTPMVPADVGDYTDFYASIFHATNVGAMFRPDAPLMPNYKFVPVGYHGRASSIVASGTAVQRPHGQTRLKPTGDPIFGPSRSLDYELELGAWVCGENAIGQSVPLASAEQRMFGLSLLNDWSARDIQSWEYQPLGPFLAKNFATSVGTWIVTLEALAPFRAPSFVRPPGDPAPLPYLDDAEDRARGGFDITLEAWLRSPEMRRSGQRPVRLSRSNFTTMYWTFGQMLTHHASNGCNLRPGDLIGSGTVSGREPDSRGCLLELAMRGAEPIALPSGETRTFLADGDEVVFRGWCERAGATRIGFGECRGEVRAAT
ncbi:MAG TPA: fumarylacetoacetase [Gemmatimonadaceae bacterium]|nr:fumarylacetoacetase [Gemmatimonadaceae bacterium]